jgi:enamine deaminase RidA (YjgF/YER057c/UK114 family)
LRERWAWRELGAWSSVERVMGLGQPYVRRHGDLALARRGPLCKPAEPSVQLREFTVIQRFDTGPRMSEMTVHNGVAYLAGQVAEDDSLDISGQTREVLAQIDALLARAGSDRSKLLRAQIFLVDLADFAAMNAVWEQWVVPGHTPARATVQAALANPKWKVEIVVTAAV